MINYEALIRLVLGVVGLTFQETETSLKQVDILTIFCLGQTNTNQSPWNYSSQAGEKVLLCYYQSDMLLAWH